MPSTYYVRRRGAVHGPFTSQRIQDAIKAKKLDPVSDEFSTTQTGPWQAVYAIAYEDQKSTHDQVSNAMNCSAYVDRIRTNSAYSDARKTINAFTIFSYWCVGIAAIVLIVVVKLDNPGWIAIFLLAVLAVRVIQLSEAVFIAFFDGVDAIIDIGRKSLD